METIEYTDTKDLMMQVMPIIREELEKKAIEGNQERLDMLGAEHDEPSYMAGLMQIFKLMDDKRLYAPPAWTLNAFRGESAIMKDEDGNFLPLMKKFVLRTYNVLERQPSLNQRCIYRNDMNNLHIGWFRGMSDGYGWFADKPEPIYNVEDGEEWAPI